MASLGVPENYIPILLFIVVGLIFGGFALIGGSLIRPSRPYRAKLTPYESGSPLFSDARIDIEVIFMVPWAVRFQSLGLLGLIEMLVFIGILLAGFWYAWKKGALEWD
jgi:NADH-quinone oxidoreductase subunit A